MTRVLWACMVYEGDAKWLPGYLDSIFDQARPPDEVVIVNIGNSALIGRAVESVRRGLRKDIGLAPLDENLGFNHGFNRAIQMAVDRQMDWLATMTVRAMPTYEWLANALPADHDAGMVTTLHVGPNGRVVCFGHNLGPEGQVFNFGSELEPDQLSSLYSQHQEAVWGPCSGGALYRVDALRKAKEGLGITGLVRPFGFKSYNCDSLAATIRWTGFKSVCAQNAVCNRDPSESTSIQPSRDDEMNGLVMNQEMNRIANLFEYWPDNARTRGVKGYLENPRKMNISTIDRAIARTCGQGLARAQDFSHVRAALHQDLEKHLQAALKAKEEWKKMRRATA